MLKQYFFAVAGLFLCLVSCQAQPANPSIKLDDAHTVTLLTGLQSGDAITTDTTYSFFNRVSCCEMSIQMHTPLAENPDRQAMVAAYKAFLRTDVVDFSAADAAFIEKIVREVFETVNGNAKDVFPHTLKLIKTTSKHVGDDVWYTRENCIIIPASALKTANHDAFKTTFFHELSHVVSRLNPDLQVKMYALVGFTSIGYDNLVVPQKLKDRLLHNPDGVDFAKMISLKQADGKIIKAIPIIYSNKLGFQKEKPDFFSYLEFNLFEIKEITENKYEVVTKDDVLSSTLNISRQPDFWRQIKDNTHYIIHPDEIMADNFAFYMQSKIDPKVIEKFSVEGKKLIESLGNVLNRKE